MIKAECHSDDYRVKASFNATKWFKQAKEKQILALAECGWKNDYPADCVAEFMERHDPGVKKMFTYIGILNEAGFPDETMGFECSVDETAAKKWLKANRPRIFKSVCALTPEV